MTRPANHDQFAGHHTHSKEEGYQPAEYEHQEYPKVVGQRDGQDVIAQNEEEEMAFLESQDEEEK
jgi:hypothetical protein